MSPKDVDLIKSIIYEAYQQDQGKLDELILSIKDNTKTQTANFMALMRAFESGLVKITKENNTLHNVINDVIDIESKSSKSIVDTLQKYGLVKDNKGSELSTKLDLEIYNNPDAVDSIEDGYSNIFDIVTKIKEVHQEIIEDSELVGDILVDQSNSLDDSVDALHTMQDSLAELYKLYSKNNQLTDLTSLNFTKMKGSMHDMIGYATKYIDTLDSGLSRVLDENNELVTESSNMKSQFGNSTFDIFGKEGLSIDDALQEISNEFAFGRQKLDLQLSAFSDSLKNILLTNSGYEVKFDDSGSKILQRTSDAGIELLDTTTTNDVIAKTNLIVENFDILSKLAAITAFDYTDMNQMLAKKLDLAKELYETHKLDDKLTTNDIKNSEDLLKYLDDYVDKAYTELDVLGEQEKMLLSINVAAASLAHTQSSILDRREAELGVIKQYNKQARLLGVVSEEVTSSISNALSSLPSFMQKFIDVDSFMVGVESSFKTASETFKTELLDNGKSVTEAMASYGKSFASSMSSAVSPATLILNVIAALGNLTYGIIGNIKNISEQLGISKRQAAELYDSMLQMEGAAGNIAVTQERILAVQSAYIEKYGYLIDLQTESGKQMVEYASLMASAYGIAADTAFEMIDTFKTLGANDELANNLAASTLEAAKLAKISPKIIAKDMVEGAEDITKFFGGMPGDAARAVVELRRMGTNIKTVGQIIQNTWNVESFMGNMYELAALTGGGIDLTNVFNAGIQNDVIGVQTALVEAIGSLSEFNDMSAQQKSLLSSTLGMSVTEIGNMMAIQEKNLQLTKEEKAALDSHLATMGDITNMSKDALEMRAKEFAATESMDMAWNKIKATLTRALLPLVEVFGDLLTAVMPVLDVIGLAFKLIGLAIKPFLPILRLFTDGLSIASGVLTDIVKWIDEGVVELENWGDGAGNFIKYLGSGILLSAVLIKYFGTIGGLLSAMASPFKKLIGSKIPGLSKITQSADKILPGSDATQTDNKKSIFSTVKNFFKKDVSSTVSESMKTEGTSKSITESVNGTSNIGEKFKNMKNQITNGLTSLLDFIKKTLTGIANAIMEPLKVIASGVGEMVQSILGGLAKGLNQFTPKALMGAGAMLIISGALWVTSKALENFNNVNWDSLAKAGLALIGLSAAALALGTASELMLIGAVAIAALGLALIPTAYALNMFNSIEWESIGKGIASLVAFAGAATLISLAAPMILIGSAAIAGLGASLLIFGAGVSILSIGAKELASSSDVISNSMKALSEINFLSIMSLGVGLMTLSVGLATASPGILLLASSFGMLYDSISRIPGVIDNINLDKLNNIGDVGVDISKNIETVNSIETVDNKVKPIPITSGKGDNINSVQSVVSSTEEVVSKKTSTSSPDQQYSANVPMNTGNIEKLVREIINVMHKYGNNPVPVVIGDANIKELSKQIRKVNN